MDADERVAPSRSERVTAPYRRFDYEVTLRDGFARAQHLGSVRRRWTSEQVACFRAWRRAGVSSPRPPEDEERWELWGVDYLAWLIADEPPVFDAEAEETELAWIARFGVNLAPDLEPWERRILAACHHLDFVVPGSMEDDPRGWTHDEQHRFCRYVVEIYQSGTPLVDYQDGCTSNPLEMTRCECPACRVHMRIHLAAKSYCVKVIRAIDAAHDAPDLLNPELLARARRRLRGIPRLPRRPLDRRLPRTRRPRLRRIATRRARARAPGGDDPDPEPGLHDLAVAAEGGRLLPRDRLRPEVLLAKIAEPTVGEDLVLGELP